MSDEPIHLEEVQHPVAPKNDLRPPMPEPPPVGLVAVADVHLPAAAGKEVELDAFYVGLLKFEREAADDHLISYRADNFRLVFDVLEPPITREEMRPTGVLVRSLLILRQQLIDLEIEHEWQRGLTPGTHQIALQDPARNWVMIGERREVG